MQKSTCNQNSKCYNKLNKRKQPLERKVLKMTTYREQYIKDMHMMDRNGNTLTTEEKELLKKEYKENLIDLGKEETLYFVALDFNVIATVVKQIVEKP